MSIMKTLFAKAAYLLAFVTLFHTTSATSFAQTAPNLGTASTYGAFSGNGAIGNTGLTIVTGDIGTFVGSFTGFPPGQYTGAKHVADAASLVAKNDLTNAYNLMNDAIHAIMFDTALNSTMGNGQILTPRTYGRSDLTTLSGTLTFDAKGNSAAVFIIKIRAALNVSKNTTIVLLNGASAANIYWAVDGAVSILDNSIFKGTIAANGAIHLYGGSSLEGRALAVVGAVTLASNLVSIPGTAAPGNRLTVITPAPADSLKRGAQNYQITWGGTGIATIKTLEYSLDSGSSWLPIAAITGDVYSYGWTVPDTISTKALVRITDQNSLRGISGLFTIFSASIPGSITIIHPSAGESVPGGTQGYQITWSGSGIANTKSFDLSLDNGQTWKLIGTISADVLSYSWNVPDTATTVAVIRITDQNSVQAKSAAFTITSGNQNVGSINSLTLRGLDQQRNIANGASLGIDWTYTPDIGTTVELEYSLDGMANWNHIATQTVTDAPTATWTTIASGYVNPVFIRITSSNGKSAVTTAFSIGTEASVSTTTSLGGFMASNFPNPAISRSTLRVLLPSTADVSVTVIDTKGTVVLISASQHFEAGTRDIVLDVSTLAPGAYKYVVRAGLTTLTSKVIVVN